MSRNSNYSRTIREAAEKIPDSEIDSLPHIIEVRRRAEKVEARHQELCARHQKMRKAAQALEARIEELKAEVANKSRRFPHTWRQRNTRGAPSRSAISVQPCREAII